MNQSNKYNIVFLIAGLLPAIIFSPYRKIFSGRHVYLALLLAIILIAPNLYWQYINDFPVVTHMNELAKTQLVNVDRGMQRALVSIPLELLGYPLPSHEIERGGKAPQNG